MDIEFILEGEKIDVLNQKIEIYFICGDTNQKITFKPNVLNGRFIMPDLYDNIYGHIVVKVNNDFYGFGYCDLRFNQNMRFVFGIDKTPYNKNYSIDIMNKNYKAIAYIEYHPLEKGEGTVSVIKILKFHKYLEESKKILM